LINNVELIVRDNISAATRVVNTVIGMNAKNFHITPGRNIRGKNATNVVSVPAINGALYSFTANNIAAFLL
jgi:hypothetical protein